MTTKEKVLQTVQQLPDDASIEDAKTSFADLLNRSRALRARPRAEIEREIQKRHAALTRTTDEVLHDWE